MKAHSNHPGPCSRRCGHGTLKTKPCMQCGGCLPDLTPEVERSCSKEKLAKFYKHSHCTCPATRITRTETNNVQTNTITNYFSTGPVAQVASPRQHCRQPVTAHPTTSQALAWLGRSISKNFQHETLNRGSPFHGVIVAIGTPERYHDNPPPDDDPLPDDYTFLVVYQDRDSETLTGEQIYAHLLPDTVPPVTLTRPPPTAEEDQQQEPLARDADGTPLHLLALDLHRADPGAALPAGHQTRLAHQPDPAEIIRAVRPILRPLWVCWQGSFVQVRLTTTTFYAH